MYRLVGCPPPSLTHGGRRLEFELKQLSKEALSRALDRAEHYRLLNEPEQAESVCRDILRIDPGNQQALVELLLSLTDQFGHGVGRLARAEEIIGQLQDEYKRSYYTGIICERQARAKLTQSAPGSQHNAYDLFREAMEWYEKAEKIRPPGNDDAILRWNSCARTITDWRLRPRNEDTSQHFLE